MIIGVPREIKDGEYRIGIIPAGVKALKDSGHRVLLEKDAGKGAGIDNNTFSRAGAEIVETIEEVYGNADMIVKVKEPLPPEYPFLRDGLILFTFLHLAPLPDLTERLVNSGCTAIAYETVQNNDGSLPILKPMSEVAGRLSVQIGARYLQKTEGGEGLLLSGVPGVEKGHVVILGGGTVGSNAAMIAAGLEAEVTVLDTSHERMSRIETAFGGRVETISSNRHNIAGILSGCDLLVGAVLLPGARTPRIVTRDMVGRMKRGSVIVDVSVDQGGCVETTHPTSHSDPVFRVADVIHYGVGNIPGIVPLTSSYALANATLPYIIEIADSGFSEAARKNPAIAKGANIYKGATTHEEIAKAHGSDFIPLYTLLN